LPEILELKFVSHSGLVSLSLFFCVSSLYRLNTTDVQSVSAFQECSDAHSLQFRVSCSPGLWRSCCCRQFTFALIYFRAASNYVKQAFEGEYPKLLRLYIDLWLKLEPHRAIVQVCAPVAGIAFRDGRDRSRCVCITIFPGTINYWSSDGHDIDVPWSCGTSRRTLSNPADKARELLYLPFTRGLPRWHLKHLSALRTRRCGFTLNFGFGRIRFRFLRYKTFHLITRNHGVSKRNALFFTCDDAADDDKKYFLWDGDLNDRRAGGLVEAQTWWNKQQSPFEGNEQSFAEKNCNWSLLATLRVLWSNKSYRRFWT